MLIKLFTLIWTRLTVMSYYTAGAIEDPIITQLIVDVLEGTKPAFDLRDSKSRS